MLKGQSSGGEGTLGSVWVLCRLLSSGGGGTVGSESVYFRLLYRSFLLSGNRLGAIHAVFVDVAGTT